MPTAPPSHKPAGQQFVPVRKPYAERQTPRKLSWSVWNRKRQYVFQRDGYRCQVCHRLTARPECDHVVAVAEGGDDDVANLQTICHACHAVKSRAEAQRQRAGPLR